MMMEYFAGFFNGFKVIVEYVPENENINFDYYPDQSQICYTHNDTMLKTTSEKVTCDKYFTGNQVRIQLSDTRTQLVLCDVRIHGDCSENVCGYDCNKVCHCKDITAGDKVTGICSNGCTGRWSGDDGACDIQCKISQWGETCQNKCGQCRDTEPCNVVTGKCPAGCEDGYKKTDLCDSECEDGTYGQNCNTTCSGNCKTKKPCTKSSGHCVDGCAPGYIGDKCDERCPLSFYGTDCKDNCSVFCTGGLPSCSNVNGSCLSGCVTGYKGLHCDKAAKQEGTETKIHISGGGLAGIVLTGVVLVFITAISTLFVAKRMQRTNMERRQNTFENEEVCYSNVSAESTSLTVNRTPGDEDING